MSKHKIPQGYTVLSVADRPLELFDFTWLVDRIEETNPTVIHMSDAQNRELHPDGYSTIRGIPVIIVGYSLFGKKL